MFPTRSMNVIGDLRESQGNVMLHIGKRRALEHAETPSEWGRVTTACHVCGIGKTRLYELLKEANGAIRTCLLKSPGAERGARLIHLPSLFGYLENLAKCQEEMS
jgi:hypothetical protein